MLTILERQFIDLYLREAFLHDYDGHAHKLSKVNGITYEHYARLYKLYQATWDTVGDWPDHLPPLPPDPHMDCPWENEMALISRISELESNV